MLLIMHMPSGIIFKSGWESINLNIKFFGHLVLTCYSPSRVGWWVLSNFPNFALSDHGVHLKILQTPRPGFVTNWDGHHDGRVLGQVGQFLLVKMHYVGGDFE